MRCQKYAHERKNKDTSTSSLCLTQSSAICRGSKQCHPQSMQTKEAKNTPTTYSHVPTGIRTLVLHISPGTGTTGREQLFRIPIRVAPLPIPITLHRCKHRQYHLTIRPVAGKQKSRTQTHPCRPRDLNPCAPRQFSAGHYQYGAQPWGQYRSSTHSIHGRECTLPCNDTV